MKHISTQAVGDSLTDICFMLFIGQWAQAEAYGHSPKREFAFLIAHSMLHLFGYDHMEEEERLVMEERQREIMEKVQILRA